MKKIKNNNKDKRENKGRKVIIESKKGNLTKPPIYPI